MFLREYMCLLNWSSNKCLCKLTFCYIVLDIWNFAWSISIKANRTIIRSKNLFVLGKYWTFKISHNLAQLYEHNNTSYKIVLYIYIYIIFGFADVMVQDYLYPKWKCWMYLLICSLISDELCKIALTLMMTSSNETIFRVNGPLCGEFTSPGPHKLHKGQRRGALRFSLICAWINDWVNNRSSWWFEMPPWSLWRQCDASDSQLVAMLENDLPVTAI